MFPLTVCAVVNDLSMVSELDTVRDHVNSLKLNFIVRVFNSSKYSDDRTNITRLPAFHIYEKKCYLCTFYLNSNPCEIIDTTFKSYKRKLLTQEISKIKWQNFFSKFIILKKFKYNFTRLEWR